MLIAKRKFFSALILTIISLVILSGTAMAAVNWSNVADAVGEYLNQAQEKYEQADYSGAKDAVDQAYFGPFEETGMEAAVRMKVSARRSFELEYGFTELKQLIDQRVSAEQLNQAIVRQTQAVKNTAVEMGGKTQTPWSGFVYSFLIILREGFEAILIIAAIIAYLTKSGNKDKVKVIYQSVIVALLASVATAFAFRYVIHISGAGQEIMEGITMLFAMVVLFFVSYWLISKVESDKWHRYIEGKIQHSVGTGNGLALWFTSFLAVYREGAETVLFYQAMFADLQGSYVPAILGFVVGCMALVVIYIVIRAGSKKIPLKPFFIATSVLLYYMAFVFAGKGVRELQEGGLIGDTLIKGFPTIDFIGVYPSWESVLLQSVLLAAVILGIIYQQIKNIGGGGAKKRSV